MRLLIWALLMMMTFAVPVTGNAQQATWEAPYRGDDPTLLYLPDTKATYWRYGWKRKPGDKSGIMITGQMPDARYFSYNVYNDDTKSTLGSFTDYQITPDHGATNPFAGKATGNNPSYTILVLPEGTKSDAKNVLYFPDALTNVSVFLRHYVAHKNFEGNVPLPKLAIYDPETHKSNVAPSSDAVPALSKQEAEKYLVPMLEKMIVAFENDPDALIQKLQYSRSGEPLDMKELIASQVVGHSFKLFKPGKKQYSLRLQTAGTYPNEDNYYLGLPVIRDKGQSLLLRVKVPNYPIVPSDYPNADVRYFSLSQGDEFSYTHGTIKDTDMKIDSDGYANFIIADDTPDTVVQAELLGANFMPWHAGDKMLMIYRHMLPNSGFDYGIDKVKPYDPKIPAADQLAIKAIGAYALVGKMINTESLQALSEFPKF